MKILIIHQYYLFPGQPGSLRFNEMARMWSERGHQVSVIAGNLNYSTGASIARSRGRWVLRERDGKVNVLRCHVPASYTRSYLGRMWAFFAFTLSAATAALSVPRPDVIIATSPPLLTAIPGWIVARMRGRRVPWVFEIRDLWPESAVTTGVLSASSLLTRVLYAIERWACRSADRVNVLTPAFREDIVRRGLANPEDIVFVPNGADVEFFKPGSRDNPMRHELGWGDRIVVLYAGAHGRANCLRQLVDVADRLRDRREILIACVGDGPERGLLSAQVQCRGLTNIRVHGPQPKERMPDIVNACDMGIAVLQNTPTFRTVYPNKIFDYMACAKPTVLAIDGVARELVCNEAAAGVYAEPENAEAIAAAIRGLADDPQARQVMGERGRRWVVEHAGRIALAERYLGILEGLACPPAGPRRGWSHRVKLRLKHGLDRIAACFALVLVAPLIVILALLVRIKLGAPIFFRQERPGHGARSFRIIKFRTMRAGAGTDAERMTHFGAFLRRTSLDELPELWNVVRGEMSLVGPRPLLMEYLDRYTAKQARRHEMKPGVTGWAQVNGRNAISWQDKLALDVWYIDHWSLWLDVKIVFLTLWHVAHRTGINAPGEVTMPEFKGSPADNLKPKTMQTR